MFGYSLGVLEEDYPNQSRFKGPKEAPKTGSASYQTAKNPPPPALNSKPSPSALGLNPSTPIDINPKPKPATSHKPKPKHKSRCLEDEPALPHHLSGLHRATGIKAAGAGAFAVSWSSAKPLKAPLS